MTRKKKILFITESQKLASGFGNYAKEILPRIYQTDKYEIAELACYASPADFNNTQWLTYGNGPLTTETDYQEQHANPLVQWGLLRFEPACLDFKPDIVATWRDPWMDAYIADSPFLPQFHWVWMPTVDSAPQKIEWLHNFSKCSALLAYSEFGIKTLRQQTHGRLIPKGCATPAIDYDLFDIVPNKDKHKEKMGLPPNSFIVGTVMRNQKRKFFADLMLSFKSFLLQASADIAEKSFLYLHTSHPETFGWDITALIHEHDLGSKVFCTYVCNHCKKYFCSHYRDAITICDHCQNFAATLPGVSNGIEHKELFNIYNLFDLYVQYSTCEGLGMPQVEAAACGVPVAAINYSAMEDVVKNTKGIPISPILCRELETNADRSAPNNPELIQILLRHSKHPNKNPLEIRRACKNRYSWDKAAKAWMDVFDSLKLEDLDSWNAPQYINPVPTEIPANLDNLQFSEWIYANVIQDIDGIYNYKMLDMMRHLNFGAKSSGQTMVPYTQQSVFEESQVIGNRRYSYDLARSSSNMMPYEFIIEAHKRMAV